MCMWAVFHGGFILRNPLVIGGTWQICNSEGWLTICEVSNRWCYSLDSEACRTAWQAGHSGRTSVLQFRGRIPSSPETLTFLLLEPSTDEMRPTYIMEGDLLNVHAHRCDSHPWHTVLVTSSVQPDSWAPEPSQEDP